MQWAHQNWGLYTNTGEWSTIHFIHRIYMNVHNHYEDSPYGMDENKPYTIFRPWRTHTHTCLQGYYEVTNVYDRPVSLKTLLPNKGGLQMKESRSSIIVHHCPSLSIMYKSRLRSNCHLADEHAGTYQPRRTSKSWHRQKNRSWCRSTTRQASK